jgi:hypothetical protein
MSPSSRQCVPHPPAPEDSSIGSIAAGKAADLVVLGGNPAQDINDIEKVETVYKDGVGYDPVKLTQSVQGSMGLR